MAKFEILNKQFERELKDLDEDLEKLKNKSKNLCEAYKKNEHIFTSQMSALTGLGSLLMLFNAINFARSQDALERFAERNKFSEEAKEFLVIQRERVHLINEAQKMGLKVDFKPERDIENFMKAEGNFKTDSFYDIFTKNGFKREAERFEKINNFTKDFVQKNSEQQTKKINKEVSNGRI